MAARVHDINEKVTGNGRGVSVYLLSSRWKSEGFILRRRSFLLDEKTPRRDERMARERQNKERERETERSCIGRARRGLSREWQKERKDDEKRKERMSCPFLLEMTVELSFQKKGKTSVATKWQNDAQNADS